VRFAEAAVGHATTDIADVNATDTSTPHNQTMIHCFLAAASFHCIQLCKNFTSGGLLGLRFCYASALHGNDWEEAGGVLRSSRKQLRGKVRPVTRKKRAPKEYPVEPELAERRARTSRVHVRSPGPL